MRIKSFDQLVVVDGSIVAVEPKTKDATNYDLEVKVSKQLADASDQYGTQVIKQLRKLVRNRQAAVDVINEVHAMGYQLDKVLAVS